MMVKGLHYERCELMYATALNFAVPIFLNNDLTAKKSQIDLRCLSILLVDLDLCYSKLTHEFVVMFIMKLTLINIVATVD